MTKVNHCLPLILDSMELVEQAVLEHCQYNFFEIWLDYIKDLSVDRLQKIIETLPDQIIFVSRRLGLEPIQRSFGERTALLKSLRDAPVLFDFDIYAQESELQFLKVQAIDIRKIISFHDYKTTPRDSDLYAVLQKMEAYGPYISKLACYCQSASDGVRLLSLLQQTAKEKRVIILGMGIHGLPTRVFGCLLGNEFTFSPVSRDAESAPGQLTRSELDQIMEIINRAGK